jgi:hypothetical protein
LRPNAVQKLRSGYERDAEAGEGEQHAAIARINLHIMNAALDGAEGDGVGDQIRLQAGLDHEQATDFLQHLHR